MRSGMVEKALSSLGKGFDLTCDFRLKYSKGDDDDDGRLIVLNESEKRTLHVPGFGPINDVPIDIRCDKGDRLRYQTDILDFNKMSEFINQKSSVSGKVPSGMFNAMFGLQSQSWAEDAGKIKYLGLDGYFISLFNLHIHRYPLLLSHHVSNAVPTSWDPPALSRFIEKYGTHIIVGLSIGGEDVVLVRQDRTSNVEPTQLKQHLDELGDQLFTGACSLLNTTKQSKHNNNNNYNKAPQAFNVFNSQPALPLVSSTQISTGCSKDGITVICSRRGGDLSSASHCEWLLTVPSKPDAIHFTFIPITSLLKGVPGKGFLSHAINLYLRYKPPIPDLQYFLDFQTHKLWAPMHNHLSLGPTTNRCTKSPSLHFNLLMGPKLYVNTIQVIVGTLPVTGMRLYLEGMKCNRLAIHLQHLSNPPIMLEKHVHNIDVPIWRGSEEEEEESRSGYIEEGKISYVCTAPVEYELGSSTSSRKDMYIVTGAQLHVKKHDDDSSSTSSSSSKKKKKVLHLRLRFTRVVGAFSVQSIWDRGESEYQMEFSSGHKYSGGLFSAISAPFGTSNNTNNSNVVVDKKKQSLLVNMDSSVFPSGPPVPVQTQKLLKYVDMSHRCKGPQDSPGHWLVTGAKLDLDKGKIRLHVKFSLFNLSSPSPLSN